MKKFYLLSLFCCLSIAAMAQVTIQIYPTGGVGTYSTGNSDGTSRNDDNIVSGNTPKTQDGYAVFDLSAIPAGATIDAVTININVATYGGGGSPSLFNTYGFVGDLSTVTVPSTLFADMTAGTSISTASYGTSTGNQVIPSSAGITGFIAANMGSIVSISFTGGGTRTYTITGESGTATPAGVHQPYLNVTYCPKPTAVVPTATPNPICQGQTLTLNTSATISGAGIPTYSWTGPAGYTSGIHAPSFAAALTSAGVYTVVVTDNCGAFSASTMATTATVTVNPIPSPIISSSVVCTTNTTTVSDTTSGGTWSCTPLITASVSPTGVVAGRSVGAARVTYTISGTGCYVTSPMTVNAPPGAITGPTALCQNQIITLADAPLSGTWSSSATLVAAVDVGGNVTGEMTGSGPVTISYTIAGCPPATYPIVVNKVPGPILGGPTVCIGPSTPTSLSDALGGGTWTATNTSGAIVSSFGFTKIFGNVAGTDTVIYTITATGCSDSAVMNIVAGPAPITGAPFVVCQGSSITLGDISPGVWSSQNFMIASVTPGSGVVTGAAAGTVFISYTMGSGCFTTQKVTVNPQPSAIIAGTTTICSNDSIALSDADPGGRWSSSLTTTATVDSLSGLVKGVSGGSATIFYTFRSTGCQNSVAMTFNSAPSAAITTSGPTTFCTGGSVTLTAPSAGVGATYQWYDAGIAIPGATTTTYSTSSTQSLTIQIKNFAGCIATSTPELVIAGISPTIDSNGSSKFCEGRNVILTAKTGSGTVGIITYQWQKNGAYIAAANANNYLANSSGVYNCVVTVSGGGSGSCSATTSSINVTAFPNPVVSVTSAKTPAGTNFTATSGFAGYQWFVNTVAIPGAVASTYTAPVNGSYRVMVTDTNGCTGYSPAFVINNVGVQQVNATDVKIYPNPANNVIHIESPVSVRAIITGIEGKTLINEANASDVNISTLPGGLYIISLYREDGQRLIVEKLVKQ